MKIKEFIKKTKIVTIFKKSRMLIIAGLSSIIFLMNCHSEKHESREKIKFLVTSPLKKDTALVKEYVCQIKSIQHIELRALEKGYLQKIYVDEGEFIKKGQPMFQIMPMLYKAELEKTKAELNFAEIEYNNTKKLADSNIVSPNELALAKATLDKAKAELSLSQIHLNFTKISAPFDGIMDRFEVRLGSLVDEGDLLTKFSDNRQMWVYFNVPEAEYLNYKSEIKNDNDIKVRLLMANKKIFKHIGKITTIEAEFNNETGNIAFRATFPNPERLLRHGETGNILINVPMKNALIIPQKATYEVLDRKYVFVIDENNVVKSRQIIVGAELPHIYVVKDGLKEGDKILLEGLRKVKEKDKISYKFMDPVKVMSHLNLYAE